jgi:hypothetical protein
MRAVFYLLCFLGFCFALHPVSAQPVINEFVSANTNGLKDPDFKEAGDWIELYNPTTNSIYIGGYFLTDDKKTPQKWAIPPGAQIAPKSYTLFWADGKNTGRHTNFKLGQDGEFIGLYSASGVLQDSLSFGPQLTDVSFGRSPDGNATWAYFSQSTPEASNNTPTFQSIAPKPTASVLGGLYATAQKVALSTSLAGAEIRFTLDGSLPTATSSYYTTPIAISANTSLRAATFKAGWKSSNILTQTYFIGEKPTLPMVSLVTDPKNFYDDYIGIYVEGKNGITGNCKTTPFNWNQDWERPVNITYYEPDGKMGFSEDAGVRIFGGCSRIYPMKSLSIHFRADYGVSEINYPLFPKLPFTHFPNFLLRTSSQDWYRTMFRDGMEHTIIQQNMRVSGMAYRPSLVFLNGQFFGIHNLREKQNEDYLAAHFGVDKNAVDMLEGNGEISEGTNTDWKALMTYFATANLSDEAQMKYVSSKIDVDNYLEYVTAEIYTANSDWPAHNIRYWREQKPDAKWRWLFFDADFGFGGNGSSLVTSNTLEWATAPNSTLEYNLPWSTLILRKLLENKTFKNAFIQRMAVHASTTFEAKHVISVIDSLKSNLNAEMPRHIIKWPASTSFDKGWENGVQIMRDFATRRAAIVRSHYAAKFGLTGSIDLNFSANNAQGGRIEVENVRVPLSNAPVTVFKDIPLKLRAFPKAGYIFAGWEGVVSSKSDSLMYTPTQAGNVKAIFVLPNVANEPELTTNTLALEVFPNPTKNTASLAFNLATPSEVQFEIFDLLGRKQGAIFHQTLGAGKQVLPLDMKAFPVGTYWIQLHIGTKFLTRSLVVRR